MTQFLKVILSKMDPLIGASLHLASLGSFKERICWNKPRLLMLLSAQVVVQTGANASTHSTDMSVIQEKKA